MKTNDEIIKTLNDLRNREGISISELARRVGMAKSSVSRYFNGTREFPLNYVDKFASALHTTPESLIGVSPVDPFKVKKLNVHSYPYIPADISAGILCNVDPLTADDIETIQLPDSVMGRYAGDSSILMMHVNGESMNQTIPDGSLIAVKQYNDIQDLKDGDIVVFADDGDYAVKYFYNDRQKQIVTFIPDSTDKRFSPIMYTYEDIEEENINIIGKVVVYTVVL
ncbi:XRE family transcriptional regulator [Lacticaseibacillus chiayiensis]|uniref:XRE family transcriptional regulator n=1 Tax=Lacticaseibacillus chiayiensis TaxID=2100821 RepID=A0ABY6H8X9_9LACO|nr:XRE family transcriptional regulator [Lacticaseibacillus chiayiensis]UYN56917.1 XRE family transcriptional regulator [Lacticaseibacillus chiayiensis]